ATKDSRWHQRWHLPVRRRRRRGRPAGDRCGSNRDDAGRRPVLGRPLRRCRRPVRAPVADRHAQGGPHTRPGHGRWQDSNDRQAVDAYIKRVNRVIAELEVRRSPPAAVRHALEQAEEKAQGLLRAAREAGEEITTSAQREAEQNTANAKREAAELLVNTSAD